MQRIVEPEILDHLPAEHPDARRSRRDLKLINFLMGNEHWIAAQIADHPAARAKGVVEIGAGTGTLLRRIATSHPHIRLTACDLAPRPADLPEQITWDQRDVFDSLAELDGGVLVANLFLHHFDDPVLERFRPLLRKFDLLCINEPLRTSQAILAGRIMLPFVGRVTRHDMIVSIRAGFLPGELPQRLGLDPAEWSIREETSWRGGLRVLASRA